MTRRSGWRSTACALASVVSESASSALSMPDALIVREGSEEALAAVPSRSPRSSEPLDFLDACLPALGFAAEEISSAASRAAFSAFLAAASAALAAVASLQERVGV